MYRLFICSLLLLAAVVQGEEQSADYAAYQMKMLLQGQAEENQQVNEQVLNDMENVCADKQAAMAELLNFVRTGKGTVRKNAIAELVKSAKANNFDRDCNSWQFDIMTAFTEQQVDHSAYRQYLFTAIAKQPSASASGLLVNVLDYALSQRMLNDEEWQQVQSIVVSAGHLEARQLMNALLLTAQAKDQRKEEHQYLVSANVDLVLANIDAIINASSAEKQTGKVTQGYLVNTLLSQSQRLLPEQFAGLYKQYAAQLDKPARLAPNMGLYLIEQPNEERIALVHSYVQQLRQQPARLGRKDAKKIISFLDKLDKSSQTSEVVSGFFDELIANNEPLVSNAIAAARLSSEQKSYWLGYYE